MARISQVNAGIVRKDFARVGEARASLKRLSTQDLLEICKKAAGYFLNGTLPLGDAGHTQSPDQYLTTLSATSGLPFVMVRRNSTKIAQALENMRLILNGLTRGLELAVLDRGFG